MVYATGRDFGGELCKALGIDPKEQGISHVRVDVDAAGIAEVVITYWMLREHGEEMTDVVRRYALVPHPEDEPAILPRLVLEEQPDV